jgi:hypothetical protein
MLHPITLLSILYIIEFAACQLQLGLLRAFLVHQQVSSVQKAIFALKSLPKSVGEEPIRLSW